MNELQQVIDDVRRGIDNAENYEAAIVGISRSEAQTLINAAQLVAMLQARCELLSRAVNAMWGLVSDEDQQAIAALLDPTGTGQPIPPGTLVIMVKRKGAAVEEV